MSALRIQLFTASPKEDLPVFEDALKGVIQKAISDYLFDINYQGADDVPPPIELQANLWCQVADIQTEILTFKPHIVHFHGHVDERGVLMINERAVRVGQQQSDFLEPELLSQIMVAHSEHIRCVLLTGFSSENMAQRLVSEGHVPCVVFTTTEVDSVACNRCCAVWYAAVFSGHSVGRAASVGELLMEADLRTRHLGANVIQQLGDEDLVLLPAVPYAGLAHALEPKQFHIPHRDVEYIERPLVWTNLREAFLEVEKRRCVVITGMGGVGKSQLALYYITDSPGYNRYRFIAWFPADDPEHLFSAYLDFAAQFMGTAGAELRGKSKKSVLPALKQWLVKQEYWLLVYDNATSWDVVAEYLPEQTNSHTQHIIITSRHQDWPSQCSTLEVEEMELSECVELIKRLCGIEPHDVSQDADICVLADLLGRLPLALSQAAAYIARQGVTVRTYIEIYEQLLVQKATASLPKGDPHLIVARTWDVTMRVLRTTMENRTPPLPPLGHILLTVCAYLAPDAIPRSLLQRWLDVAYPALPAGVDMCSVLLGLLRDYSLIQFVDAEKRTIRVHRVLRMVVKHQHERVEPEHQRQGVVSQSSSASPFTYIPGGPPRQQTTSIRDVWYPLPGLSWLTPVVLAANAEYDRQWERIVDKDSYHRLLLPHIEWLASYTPVTPSLVGGVEAAAALGRLLRSVGNELVFGLGMYEKGQKHLRKALYIFETVYGPRHVEVAGILNGLGSAYGYLGDYSKQKELLERALVIKEAAYGPHHVEVAVTLTNLGNAYGSLGDYKKQKELLKRALAIKEARCGRNHVSVAVTLTNLGIVYGALGNYIHQRALLERALAINETAYGQNHVEVARTLTNLGHAYGSLGDYNRQKEVLERALEIKEAAYGPNHVSVAVTLAGLGDAYGSLRDYTKQKKLLERALVIEEAAYGLHHVEVAVTLLILSNAYGSLRDYTKQKELLERALVIEEAAYGAHHLYVATTLHGLANAYGSEADYQKKKDLLIRALRIEEQCYGLNNHQLATTLQSLSEAYESLGDIKQQEEAQKRAVSIRVAHESRKLPAHSPLTVATIKKGDLRTARLHPRLTINTAMTVTTSVMPVGGLEKEHPGIAASATSTVAPFRQGRMTTVPTEPAAWTSPPYKGDSSGSSDGQRHKGAEDDDWNNFLIPDVSAGFTSVHSSFTSSPSPYSAAPIPTDGNSTNLVRFSSLPTSFFAAPVPPDGNSAKVVKRNTDGDEGEGSIIAKNRSLAYKSAEAAVADVVEQETRFVRVYIVVNDRFTKRDRVIQPSIMQELWRFPDVVTAWIPMDESMLVVRVGIKPPALDHYVASFQDPNVVKTIHPQSLCSDFELYAVGNSLDLMFAVPRRKLCSTLPPPGPAIVKISAPHSSGTLSFLLCQTGRAQPVSAFHVILYADRADRAVLEQYSEDLRVSRSVPEHFVSLPCPTALPTGQSHVTTNVTIARGTYSDRMDIALCTDVKVDTDAYDTLFQGPVEQIEKYFDENIRYSNELPAFILVARQAQPLKAVIWKPSFGGVKVDDPNGSHRTWFVNDILLKPTGQDKIIHGDSGALVVVRAIENGVRVLKPIAIVRGGTECGKQFYAVKLHDALAALGFTPTSSIIIKVPDSNINLASHGTSTETMDAD